MTDQWKDAYIDYYKSANELRIDVRGWVVLQKIEDQYFVRPKDWRLVLNYLKQIGIKAVLRKIASRSKELARNEKYLSLGIGIVRNADAEGQFSAGQPVIFLVANHPRCVDRVCVDRRFAAAMDAVSHNLNDSELLFFERAAFSVPALFYEYAGWTEFSGLPVDADALKQALKAATAPLLNQVLKNAGAVVLPVDPRRPDRDVIKPPAVRENTEAQKSAVLFGLGNYAKVTILPFIDKRLRIQTIHEIDPLQIGPADNWDSPLDSSPMPREHEKYDVWFIAGYHHTHQPLAVHALRKGAYAVIEKPLATTVTQLQELESAVDPGFSRYFACFHKRYNPMNDWAIEDMNIRPGDPVSYHCIVYEVALPRRHWYRWPNSRSRLTSNGCHWIDHFMFLNGYADVRTKAAQRAKNGDVSVFVELVNDAVFSMILTDTGSDRIGLRDYIEIKNGHTTVRMTDSSRYDSENRTKIIRRKRINSIGNYERMYRTISQKILAGQPGDPAKYLKSSALVLELEELL